MDITTFADIYVIHAIACAGGAAWLIYMILFRR